MEHNYANVYDVVYRLDGHEIRIAEPEHREWPSASDGLTLLLPDHSEHLQIRIYESAEQAEVRARELHAEARLELRSAAVFAHTNALLVITPGTSQAIAAVRADLESDSWRPDPVLRNSSNERRAERIAANSNARAIDERSQQAIEVERQRQTEAQRTAPKSTSERAELERLTSLYSRAINTKIRHAWPNLDSVGVRVDCQVMVTQLPAGEVVGVEVESCVTDSAHVRDIVARVVRTASPLPSAPAPEVFDQELRIRVLSPERAE